MHRLMSVCVLSLFLIGLSDGRGFRGGRSSFSGSRSISRSISPSRSSRSSRSTITSRSTKKPSTIKKSAPTKTQKPKAVSKSRLDRQRQKQLVSKDKAAFKKYSNKSEAQKAYKKSLASKNSYSSPTPPASRPKYIPQTTTVGGRSYDVTYSRLPGGGFGYGYYDPTTSTFVALTAHQMMVDASMMRAAGYGQWDNSGRPVVVRSGMNIFIIVCSLILLVILFISIVRVLKES